MGDDPGRSRVGRAQSQASRRGGRRAAVVGRPGDAEAEAGVMPPLAEGHLGLEERATDAPESPPRSPPRGAARGLPGENASRGSEPPRLRRFVAAGRATSVARG